MLIEVEMKTTYAGPSGTCQAGKKIHLPEKEAKELVDGGFAVMLEPKEKEQKKEKEKDKDKEKDKEKEKDKDKEKDKEKEKKQ